MITFLASPKPFIGPSKQNQYRAIRSWQRIAEDVEVILYGNSAGITDAGHELGVRVKTNIESSKTGVPYFGAMVAHAAEYGKNELQVYLNCDILLSGIGSAMRQIAFPHFLLIGQRIDLGPGQFVDVACNGWKNQLIEMACKGHASLHGPTGIDYFGFRRGMWQGLPDIVIGRAGYDNALICHCMRNRIPIIDGTFAVTAMHQYHDYEHVRGGESVVMHGLDAQNNFVHAGEYEVQPWYPMRLLSYEIRWSIALLAEEISFVD